MTDEEWQNIDQLLASWWGQPWDSRKSEGYRLALDRFEPGRVARALEAAGRKDPKWRPGALELVAIIEGPGPSSPSFGEAWPMIARALNKYPGSTSAPVDAIRRKLGNGPAGFVRGYGVQRLRMEPIYGEHGGAILARLEAAYNEACRAVAEDGRVAMTLRSGEPRRLGAGLPGLGVGDG